MINVGDMVVWSQRRQYGKFSVEYKKKGGRVLSLEGQVAVVAQNGNQHRLRIHVSRLTIKESDDPFSLVKQAKVDLGIQ